MFKRFWESLNYWAEALSMDDPRGDYMFRLEDRVSKLEREVEGLRIKSRMTPAASATERVHQQQSHLPQ
ncbi:hypothetical protein [Bradyrhizobium sp.]|uniref:hypothetical protein n=1 Tax=Bradyrhizobium sp. TaxID=376 RepID=UPI0040376A13